MKRQTIKHLPEKLIEEILSNLPVQSLLRFKSVSKPWCSLISSARFAKEHLNRSNSDPDLTHHNLIGIFYSKKTWLRGSSCPLKPFLVEPNQDDVVSTWDHRDIYAYGERIIASCNGLLLITDRHMYEFYLWNPSTRERQSIEYPPSYSPQEEDDHECTLYGFGYDDSTDDYKLVWVTYSSIDDDSVEFHHTEVYSLRADSWKKIDTFEKSLDFVGWGHQFLNGKLHWLAEKEGVSIIVSLSLAEGEEKYQLLATTPDHSRWGATLENLGGYLSLIDVLDYRDITVWIMIKYGVAESWTKIWTFSDFHDPRLIYDNKVQPFWATKNGDIFVAFDKSKVVVYNAKNKVREYRLDKDKLESPGVNAPISKDDNFHECSARLGDPLLVYVECLGSPFNSAA